MLQVGRGIGDSKVLSQLLDVSPQSLTVLASRTIKKGLLERERVQQDARRVHFRLTVKGCVAVRKIEDTWLQT